MERPGITAREGHGELTAFDVEAGRGAAGVPRHDENGTGWMDDK